MITLKEGLLSKKNIKNVIDIFDRFKNGDIIQVRLGVYYMFSNNMSFIEASRIYTDSDYDNGMFFRDEGYLIYKDYDKNLKNIDDKDFDIIAVYRPRILEKSYKQEKLTEDFLKDLTKKSKLLIKK